MSVISSYWASALLNDISSYSKPGWFRRKYYAIRASFRSAHFREYELGPSREMLDAVTKSCSLISQSFHSNRNCVLVAEAEKVVARLQLRFSVPSLCFAKCVAEKFVSNRNFLRNLSFERSSNLYYSPLYPLVHLPGDVMEEGTPHIDYIPFSSVGSRILWIPLLDYNYDAISCDKGLAGIFAQSLRSNEKQAELMKTAISSPIHGSCYGWTDTFLHKGNLNTSKIISAAAVMRFTYRPLKNESYVRISQGKIESSLSSKIDKYLTHKEHNKLLEIVFEQLENLLLKSLMDYKSDRAFDGAEKSINEFVSVFDRRSKWIALHLLSFGVEMYLQRLTRVHVLFDDSKIILYTDWIENLLYFAKSYLTNLAREEYKFLSKINSQF